ncbi:unnamed protein product [Phytophthora fragariaefolia]|uniref:Unnamed protein product n=1 Tax=Phytophthora fragariaefolia TaxID=1490495 RepID=A0A9W6X3J9_9STRA|nr:unnamed protein product [Phytophthora fragariaefolia]
MNVECETRVCTFCIIRATDTSIKANEAAMRDASAEPLRLSGVSILSLASTAIRRRDKQLTLLSADSELTTGSIVQLWPQPVPANENARLRVARHSTIRSTEADPTMNLLVNLVARTLECPAAFIGIMDDSTLWVKASVGLDERITHIPRDGCVCAYTVMQDCTMIVDDTSADKHFHAGGHTVGSSSMRYYAGTPIRVRGHGIGVVCALDTDPHSKTTNSMKSTLEAVANIVSEVLEQRVASDGTMNSPMDVRTSISLSCYRRRSENTDVDLHASLDGLNLLPSSRQTTSSSSTSNTNTTYRTSYLQHQCTNKISVAMDYFHKLQRSTWADLDTNSYLTNNGSIRTFEHYDKGKQFTRSIMKMNGDCHSVACQLLDYGDALLYQLIFSRVSGRRELSEHTWSHSATLHPTLSSTDDSSRILTHRREYPDGSNVVVAVSDKNYEEASESNLLFGWFIVPCSRDDDVSFVTVSCITAQTYRSQPIVQNLSLDLLRRLNQKLAMSHFFHLPSDAPCIKPSALRIKLGGTVDSSDTHKDDVVSSDETGLDLNSHDSDSTITSSSGNTDHTTPNDTQPPSTNVVQPEDNRAALVALHETGQISELNQNEQMLLDLLDKTISTQEILAQRQHEMADLIDTHGNQLQRITIALERVESLIALKQQAKKAKLSSTAA